MQGRMKGIWKAGGEAGAVYREDLPIPITGEDQALVKIKVAAICGTDQHIYHWDSWAQERVPVPMVFGHEFAGEIVEIGRNLRGFQIGDRVAGETHIPCSSCYMCRTGNQHNCEEMKIIGVHVPGAFCEYIAVPQDCLWKLSPDVDYRTGAMLEPMGVAVHGVMSGEIGGRTALILGCGPVGVMAVGAAAAAGASKIFAVDLVKEKLDMAKSMGADYTINTAEENFVEVVLSRTAGRGAEAVIDYTGNAALIEEAFSALAKGGRFTMVGLPKDKLQLDLTNQVIYKEARINGVTGRLMYQTWWQCESLLSTGKYDINKVVGGIYRLEDFKKAFEYIDRGRPGKMIFEVDV